MTASQKTGDASRAFHSRFVQRLRRRYAAELHLLAPGAPVREHMVATYAALRTRGDNAADALRIVRQ